MFADIIVSILDALESFKHRSFFSFFIYEVLVITVGTFLLLTLVPAAGASFFAGEYLSSFVLLFLAIFVMMVGFLLIEG